MRKGPGRDGRRRTMAGNGNVPGKGEPAASKGGTYGPAEQPLTYKVAGVDVDAAAQLVGRIGAHVARTARPGVLGDIGGFGGLFALDKDKYDEPVLVAGADGVGTKLQIAFAMDKHDTIGQDCVAMCVNDIAVQGAEPLFFLDYIGTGRLETGVVEQIVSGVADGCQAAGCALLGGETAEMPDSYGDGEYDIAGFAVGVVDKAHIVDGRAVQAGDAVVGLASSGVHSNGYSLVRRLLARIAGAEDGRWTSIRPALALKPPELKGATLGEELLKPTRIYAKTVSALLELGFDIRGMAHITGGGLTDNIPRVLPSGLGARLHPERWSRPPIFDWLRREGPVEDGEMRRTFNDGIGFVFIVPDAEGEALAEAAADLGERAFVIGEVIELPSADAGADPARGGAGSEGDQRVLYE